MAEQVRLGDIVIDLRTSYDSEGEAEVKIKRLKVDGTPANPTITLELHLIPKVVSMIPKNEEAIKEVNPK